MAIPIQLQQCNGAVVTVQIPLSARVCELKRKAAEKLGMTEGELILMFCGEDLDNSRTLESYSIPPGVQLQLEYINERVQLVVSLPGGENIVVSVRRSAEKAEVIKAIRATNPSDLGEFELALNEGIWAETKKASTVSRDEVVRIVGVITGGV